MPAALSRFPAYVTAVQGLPPVPAVPSLFTLFPARTCGLTRLMSLPGYYFTPEQTGADFLDSVV